MKLIAMISASLLIVGTLSAQEEKQNNNLKPEITLESHWFSAYVGPNGLYYSNKSVIQTSLTAAWECGLYLNVWWSADAGGDKSSFGNEFDYTLGYGRELVWGINIDLSVSYCDLVALGNWKDDMLWWQGSLERPVEFVAGDFTHEIKPYARMEYYQYLVQTGEESLNGFLFEVGSAYSVTYKKLTVGARFGLVHDDGLFAGSRGQLLMSQLSASFKVSDHVSIDGSYTLYSPLSRFDDGRFNKNPIGVGVWSVGATITF